jgi:predicted transposase YbfD/YdcC
LLPFDVVPQQKSMTDENGAFTAEETETANNLTAHLKEQPYQSQALVEVQSEIARIFTQTEMLHKDHAQFMEISQAFDSKKEEHENERVARIQLFTTKNALESEMTRVEKKVTRAKHAVIQLENKWTKVASKKLVNDGIEAEQLVPGRAEMDALVAEKDKLLRLAQDLENKLDVTSSIDQDKKRLEDLKAQVSTATKLAKEKADILSGLSASSKAAQELHEKKQAGLAKAIQDVKMTTDTKRQRRENGVEAVKEERRLHAAKLRNKLDILQYGCTLILDSKQAEEREATGATLNDDE